MGVYGFVWIESHLKVVIIRSSSSSFPFLWVHGGPLPLI